MMNWIDMKSIISDTELAESAKKIQLYNINRVRNLLGEVKDFGQNSSVDQEVIDVNSGNDNRVNQNVDQVNKDGKTSSTLCLNSYGSLALLGFSDNNIINSGDNNEITINLTNTNSNNRNDISQEGDQTNQHCLVSSCSNSVFALANISAATVQVVNGESNAQITESPSANNANNENTVSQAVTQSNLCREASQCSNSGNLVASINGQSNQDIDQSLGQNNLCLNNAICNNNGEVVSSSVPTHSRTRALEVQVAYQNFVRISYVPFQLVNKIV